MNVPDEVEDGRPRAVRGLFSAVGRALLGLAAGAALGPLVFAIAGLPLLDGAVAGGWSGLLVGAAAGVVVWAFFPYRPDR